MFARERKDSFKYNKIAKKRTKSITISWVGIFLAILASLRDWFWIPIRTHTLNNETKYEITWRYAFVRIVSLDPNVHAKQVHNYVICLFPTCQMNLFVWSHVATSALSKLRIGVSLRRRVARSEVRRAWKDGQNTTPIAGALSVPHPKSKA
jgi:hypothetical protein